MKSQQRASRLSLEALEAREVPVARIQFVNNTPFNNNNFDIYINNAKYLNDLAFRTASPFSDVAQTIPLKIDLVPNTATNNSSPIFTTTVTLLPDSRNIATIVGDPAQSTGVNKLDIRFLTTARETATISGKTDVMVMHGSPDAGPVDLKLRGTGTLVNDAAYPLYNSSYLSLNPANYILDLAASDGVTRVASYSFDATSFGSKAVTIMASGFANPGTGAPALGLLVVQSDGFTRLLSTTRPWIDQNFAVGGANAAGIFNFKGQSLFNITPFEAGSTAPARVATADMNGDGVQDLVVAAGPGRLPTVTIYDGKTQQIFRNFAAFEESFRGGVFVSLGDLDGDTIPEMIVTPDQGGGPRVRIFRGKDGSVYSDFFGIEDPNFRGGARTAVGDLNRDGVPDVIVAAGFGGGPRVAGFTGPSLAPGNSPVRLFADFFVFEQTLRNGVYVAAGDLNGDGNADLIVGGGPGGGPRITAFSGVNLVQNKQDLLTNFFAGDTANRDGVRLAVKDLDGDYQMDLIVGLGSPNVPQVRTFRGKDLLNASQPGTLFDLNPFGAAQPLGVFVG